MRAGRNWTAPGGPPGTGSGMPSGRPSAAGSMDDVTRILTAVEQGDTGAPQQLLPLVYDELRRLAAARMASEAPGQTLDATALVHEAYLRLVGSTSDRTFANRKHFFVAASEAMRRILVENARRKGRAKRAELRRVELEGDALKTPQRDERLLAMDDGARALRSARAGEGRAAQASCVWRLQPCRGRGGFGNLADDGGPMVGIRASLAAYGGFGRKRFVSVVLFELRVRMSRVRLDGL